MTDLNRDFLAYDKAGPGQPLTAEDSIRLKLRVRGAIPNQLPPLLERLNIDSRHWLYCSQHFESRFKGLVGSALALKQACATLGYLRIPAYSA